MAAVSLAARLKSISRKMSRVPVESVTDLKTCSTAMMGTLAALIAAEVAELFESDMRLSLYRRHFSAAALLATGMGICGMALSADSMAPPANKADKADKTILVLGDSLSAEYGLKRGTGWVALLEQQLNMEKINARVINASISGDTTSGGVSRLPALLARYKPTQVVIELGGNDALRGLPLKLTQDNLTQMTMNAQQNGAKALLVGMQVPPNYGANYANQFAATFASVAKDRKAALVPFLLKGVADVPNANELFQADRIHPKAEAHPTMLANVWVELKKILK
jgi:acyl-CoA thioesterase-1